MSREIKFRAWDEGNKVMHNDFKFISSGDAGNDWIVFISDKFTLENHDTNPFANPSPYFSQQLKKMQYTGLKDKNGIEIYEFDIVEMYSKVGRTKTKGGVYYDYRVCAFMLDDSIFKQYLPITKDDEIEVIGNVYENIELLDG